MNHVIAYVFLGAGIALLLSGLLLGWGQFAPPPAWWANVAAGAGLIGMGTRLRHWGREMVAERRLRRARSRETELAAELTPHLFGDYSPYVMEAAEKLGEAKDASAVPALCRALEECVDSQRPGWREVAEALANALARIGDRRALPLLLRLENVRGIGFIPAVRQAIAAIEPQTSLLRPGTAEDASADTLLRPARSSDPDASRRLLRATSGNGE